MLLFESNFTICILLRGVLSQQELDDYHNISTESSDHSTAGASTPSNDHWRRRSYMYNVPNLVPANSLRSQEAINVRILYNSMTFIY